MLAPRLRQGVRSCDVATALGLGLGYSCSLTASFLCLLQAYHFEYKLTQHLRKHAERGDPPPPERGDAAAALAAVLEAEAGGAPPGAVSDSDEDMADGGGADEEE